MPSIPIRVGEKIVGSVVGKLFIKRVVGSKHFLRSPRAIAFDTQSLNNAKQAGATELMVIDKETGIAYVSSMEHFYQNGFYLERGFGKQMALSIDKWSTMNPQQPPLLKEEVL